MEKENSGSSRQEGPTPKAVNIQRILDLELDVSVVFGSAVLPLEEILKLSPGSIIELDQTMDEPVLLKVNDKVFARGEVVVVDGYYGVKIREISDRVERIANLGEES